MTAGGHACWVWLLALMLTGCPTPSSTPTPTGNSPTRSGQAAGEFVSTVGRLSFSYPPSLERQDISVAEPGADQLVILESRKDRVSMTIRISTSLPGAPVNEADCEPEHGTESESQVIGCELLDRDGVEWLKIVSRGDAHFTIEWRTVSNGALYRVIGSVGASKLASVRLVLDPVFDSMTLD